jgi:hypothetical protein
MHIDFTPAQGIIDFPLTLLKSQVNRKMATAVGTHALIMLSGLPLLL